MSCISVNHNPQRTQAEMLDFGVTVMSTEFTFLHTCIPYANLPCPLSLCFQLINTEILLPWLADPSILFKLLSHCDEEIKRCACPLMQFSQSFSLTIRGETYPKSILVCKKKVLYIVWVLWLFDPHTVLQQVGVSYSPALDVGLNYTELQLLFSSWLQISGCYACVN